MIQWGGGVTDRTELGWKTVEGCVPDPKLGQSLEGDLGHSNAPLQVHTMVDYLMRTHIVWVHMYCTVSNTCTARPYTNRQSVEFSVLCHKQV